MPSGECRDWRSTNAVLHLLALAGRVGVKLELADFDHLGHDSLFWWTLCPPAAS